MGTGRDAPKSSAIVASAGAVALLLSGCAVELHAQRVVKADAIPPAGAPYNLTFTQYEIAVQRRLDSCKRKDGVAEMSVAVEASATRKEVRDPTREYVIDFASLRSFFKTSNVTVEYHPNGALKSVNAAAEDKSAEFLASTFTSLRKIAGLGSAPVAAGAAPLNKFVCEPDIEKLLAQVPVMQAAVAAQTKTLQDATTDLIRLTEIGAAMGKAWGDRDRAALGAQIAKVYDARAALDAGKQALSDALKKLTISTTIVWPLDGETRGSGEGPLIPGLTRKELQKWAPTKDVGGRREFDESRWSLTDDNARAIETATAIHARIRHTSPIGSRPACAGDVCADDGTKGLKFRMPAPGVLLLCTDAACRDPKAESTVLAVEGTISQLGPVLALPLKNYPFMKQSVEATFNEAGQPTKIGYRDESAAAVGLATTFGSLVDEVAKAREASRPKTELEKLKEETELLKARQELAAAKKALDPPKFGDQAEAAAAFNADTDVLKAELAKLQAEAALAAAKAQAQKP